MSTSIADSGVLPPTGKLPDWRGESAEDTNLIRAADSERAGIPQAVQPRRQGDLLPQDHPDRVTLAYEVHARPPEALPTPSRASYLALLVDPAARAEEHLHLSLLCQQFNVEPPSCAAKHFTADLGDIRFKWEKHSEFSGYTFVTTGRSPTPFSEPPVARLPRGWLAALPGQTIFAAHAKLVPTLTSGEPSAEFLATHFGTNIAIGAKVGGGAGSVYTDLHIHDDGFARILLLDQTFTPRQAGRMLQRLFEIEAYRMLALLALPLAHQQAQRLATIELSLAQLIAGISREGGNDESILHELTRLSRDVESSIDASQFRFGACAAYHELVASRIAELREERIGGIQTIEEFMKRRFSPAVATVANTWRRLQEIADRVTQACALLSTRVAIVREKQNQGLLASMDRRARQQLRLQQTVEGLSLAAILYYVVGLFGYVAKALKAGGFRVEPDLIVGAAVLPLALLLLAALRRARRRAHES